MQIFHQRLQIGLADGNEPKLAPGDQSRSSPALSAGRATSRSLSFSLSPGDNYGAPSYKMWLVRENSQSRNLHFAARGWRLTLLPRDWAIAFAVLVIGNQFGPGYTLDSDAKDQKCRSIVRWLHRSRNWLVK
jgi:hypothetical protein